MSFFMNESAIRSNLETIVSQINRTGGRSDTTFLHDDLAQEVANRLNALVVNQGLPLDVGVRRTPQGITLNVRPTDPATSGNIMMELPPVTADISPFALRVEDEEESAAIPPPNTQPPPLRRVNAMEGVGFREPNRTQTNEPLRSPPQTPKSPTPPAEAA